MLMQASHRSHWHKILLIFFPRRREILSAKVLQQHKDANEIFLSHHNLGCFCG